MGIPHAGIPHGGVPGIAHIATKGKTSNSRIVKTIYIIGQCTATNGNIIHPGSISHQGQGSNPNIEIAGKIIILAGMLANEKGFTGIDELDSAVVDQQNAIHEMQALTGRCCAYTDILRKSGHGRQEYPGQAKYCFGVHATIVISIKMQEVRYMSELR
jgi:hypothetical protein